MIKLRAEYCTRFAELAGVARCVPHDSELDQAEVARIGAVKTPAVLVACLGGPTLERTGITAAQLEWVAVVIARSPDRVATGQATAGDVAAAIALLIQNELAQGDLFVEAIDRPSSVEAINGVRSSIAGKGYALWAVGWKQSAQIVPAELVALLDNLVTIHTDMDLPPNTGVDASIDTKNLQVPPP